MMTTTFTHALEDAILVVAHPDDEILWFSSIFDRFSAIIVCYLDVPGQDTWTRGRRAVAKEYPHGRIEFLGLTESVAFRGADWASPTECEYGVVVSRRPGTLPAFDADRYRVNYDHLVEALQSRLKGARRVFTHNPWGEYGNEEHVQVYRAVTHLAPRLGYDVWYSNYCSDRSFALMRRHVGGWRSQGETLPTQPALVAPIEALYRQHDCWTWPFDDFVYFPTETFLRDGDATAEPRGSTVPLNYIHVIDRPPPVDQHQGRFGIRKLAHSASRRARNIQR